VIDGLLIRGSESFSRFIFLGSTGMIKSIIIGMVVTFFLWELIELVLRDLERDQRDDNGV